MEVKTHYGGEALVNVQDSRVGSLKGDIPGRRANKIDRSLTRTESQPHKSSMPGWEDVIRPHSAFQKQ